MKNSARKKILIVDDTPENIDVLGEVLKPYYKRSVALNGEKGLQIAGSSDPPDLILLDIMMPGMDGYEVCRRLKDNEKTKGIPIIFVTAKSEVEDESKGFELGAVDYITKPISPSIVLARVKTHLELKLARDALENQNEILEQKVKERTVKLVELNTTLESFVPREFLNLLGKESILEISLGDQIKQEMTIMFADIRGWTTLSENMTPQENFSFINAYLRRVSPVIKQYNGFIDQYYGDGVMALFPGTPEDAVMAAIAMHMAVDEYNKEREKEGFRPIGIGVGLHVGELMLGIIGSEKRMQAAVVADAVNLAARLEALTRIYGSSITLSEPTLSTLKDPDKYKHRFVDKVRVKGKKMPASVYEVFDADPQRVAELKERTKANFEEGLRLYYETKFSKASVQFNQVLEENPEDKAARIYLKRCANYMVQGVPEGWTGVESLTKK